MNEIHEKTNIETEDNSFITNPIEFVARKIFNEKEIDLSNTMASIWFELTKPTKDRELFFSNTSYIEKRSPTQSAICIAIEIFNINLKIHLDRMILEYLISGSISYQNFIRLPIDLKLLIINDSIRTFIKSIKSLSEADINLDIIENSENNKNLGVFEFFAHTRHRTLGRVSIEFDEHSADQLEIVNINRSNHYKKHGFVNHFPVFGRILIDTVFIKRPDVYTLSQGDVLLTHLSANDNSATIQFSKKIIFDAKIHDKQLKILKTGAIQMHNAEINEKNSNNQQNLESNKKPEENITDRKKQIRTKTQPNQAQAKDTSEFNIVELDDIDVELTFDLGNTEVSLSDISSIKPGYVLEMPDSYERTVYIRNSGRLIAKGELVQVGGNLGVEISEIKYGIS